MFQFQYGAIGSVGRDYNGSFALVSIPVWCDWESGAKFFGNKADKFQFQYGAIGRNHGSIYWIAYYVSIPVWCDWEMEADCC